MRPEVRGPHIPETLSIRCPNCGEAVTVSKESERAACRRCANVWKWTEKRLIRGQR